MAKHCFYRYCPKQGTIPFSLGKVVNGKPMKPLIDTYLCEEHAEEQNEIIKKILSGQGN